MSMTVRSGAKVDVMGACVRALGETAIAVTKVIEKAVHKIVEGDPQLYEQLKLLTIEKPISLACSPKEARIKFNEIEKHLNQILMDSNPSIAAKQDLVSLIALQKSPLECFVDPNDINLLNGEQSWTAINQRLLNNASKRMADCTGQHIASSIISAAKAEGFKDTRRYVKKNQSIYVSMVNKRGQAVVSSIQSRDDGASVSIDLAGITDNSCQEIIEKLLNRINKDGVRLSGAVLEPHQPMLMERLIPSKLHLPAREQGPKPIKENRKKTRRLNQAQQDSQVKQCLLRRS